MTLGQEFRELVEELLAPGDDSFASTMRWRHFTRTEDPSLGTVTSTPTTVTFRGAVTDPVRTRLFGDATLQQARTAVLAPPTLTVVPALLAEVEVSTGRWLRVVDVKELLGPGDAGSPVLIAYVAALGSS